MQRDCQWTKCGHESILYKLASCGVVGKGCLGTKGKITDTWIDGICSDCTRPNHTPGKREEEAGQEDQKEGRQQGAEQGALKGAGQQGTEQKNPKKRKQVDMERRKQTQSAPRNPGLKLGGLE